MRLYICILSFSVCFFLSCEKKKEDPQIKTVEAIPTSAVSCVAKGYIEDRGDYTINDYGFIYSFLSSESSNMINNQLKVSLGKTITKDTFSATLPLSGDSYYSSSSNYKWYVKAYITNSKGTVYAKAVSFFPLVLSITGIQPSSAKVGDTITILGNNFDLNPANISVTFYNYGSFTAQIVGASKTKLKVIVPNITSGSYYDYYFDITVTIGGKSQTLNNIFSLAPSVTSYSPSNGTFGSYITINGKNLSQCTVMLGSTSVSASYGSDYLDFYVPNNIKTKKFKIYVIKGSNTMEVPGGEFVMNDLAVTSCSPLLAYPGTEITILGSNFNSSSYNKIFIGSTLVLPSYSSSSTSMMAVVPNSIKNGDYILSVTNGIDSVVLPGTIKIAVPFITGVSPTSGYIGTNFTVNGHNFNTSSNRVFFNDYYNFYGAICDSISYKLKVPCLSPGTYKIFLVSGQNQFQSPIDFTILAPTVSSITPNHGVAGSFAILTGEGFCTNQCDANVQFGSYYASLSSSTTNNQINPIVPNNIGNGAWAVKVTVNGCAISNTLTFTVP